MVKKKTAEQEAVQESPAEEALKGADEELEIQQDDDELTIEALEARAAAKKARAKELEEGLAAFNVDDLKLKDIGISKDKQKELLVPLEDYVKSGIHLGTKVISGDMRQFVYRRRADGLAILNTNLIDAKLRDAMKVLEAYDADDIILVCKREAGWTAARKFGEVTGVRSFTKKYPAGIITNPELEDFFEPSLVIVSDPWLDKNALKDANNIRAPVVGLCDTNNILAGIHHIVPCNNKSNKSIGLVLYILAKHYCSKKGLPFNAQLKDFAGEEM